jgi:aldose sugar dehydrogenase
VFQYRREHPSADAGNALHRLQPAYVSAASATPAGAVRGGTDFREEDSMIARPSSPVRLGVLTLALGTMSGCVDDQVLQPERLATAANAVAGPMVLDRNLEVRRVIDGLVTPITMAFLGPGDILVLEKNTGQVKRVVNGSEHSIVLDLAVNFGSERGLLGIALHPAFPTNPGVYLYWTESTTGDDTDILSATPQLGNRVDRYVWDGASLAFDENLIQIRAIQQDAGQPERGNHDGGVIEFGPDGKLYIFVGDVGRRGRLQNLRCGPTDVYDCPPGTPVPDDQFGGPEPDDAHMTGVVLRLNDDGSTPADNPFFAAGAGIGGEAGANIQKIFSYGHRNSFGMAFDPRSGDLWLQENGDDAFSELNRVLPGMNGGWIQIMGPVSRIAQFKEIETSPAFFGLQQIRWPPTNIASSPAEALSRLFMLPGAHYSDPEFSWKFEVSPGGIGFIEGRGLGPQYDGRLVMGGARDFLLDGHLFLMKLTGNRDRIAVDDPRLEDRVADNVDKWEITESESLLFGTGFGVVTDVETGPNGSLFLISLTHGSVYEISRRVRGRR